MINKDICPEEYIKTALRIEKEDNIDDIRSLFYELIEYPNNTDQDFIKNIAPIEEEVLSKHFKDVLMETRIWSKKKPYGLITTIAQHTITINHLDRKVIEFTSFVESSKLPFETIINRTRAAALLRAIHYLKTK